MILPHNFVKNILYTANKYIIPLNKNEESFPFLIQLLVFIKKIQALLHNFSNPFPSDFKVFLCKEFTP